MKAGAQLVFSFVLSIQSGVPAHRTVLSTLMVAASLKPLWKCPLSHAHWCVSYVILSPIRLTMHINHHKFTPCHLDIPACLFKIIDSILPFLKDPFPSNKAQSIHYKLSRNEITGLCPNSVLALQEMKTFLKKVTEPPCILKGST